METKYKLKSLLADLIDFRLNSKVSIETYRGSRDAEQFRWFTMGLYPQIVSLHTMTEVLKAKEVFYVERESGIIEIVLEDISKNNFNFYVVINPKTEFSYQG